MRRMAPRTALMVPGVQRHRRLVEVSDRSWYERKAWRFTFENLKQLSQDWRYEGRMPIADDIGRAFRWCDDVAAAVGEISPLGRT